MISRYEVLETNKMIQEENLDIRTITMGINLLDCISDDMDKLCNNVYEKITRKAEHLVSTGESISKKYGIPIVNKRISVTPIALIGGATHANSYVPIAKALDRAAQAVGVNFIGGFSALVHKGCTPADNVLIESIPEALDVTQNVCASINLGTTRTGINMDAVKRLGEIIKLTAERTADRESIGCAKLVVFCNAPEDNPFKIGRAHV